MNRREFMSLTATTALALGLNLRGFAATRGDSDVINASWWRRRRRFIDLKIARVAYLDYGSGPAALFLHGFPLNGYQWRGALERLHGCRRCIAPDFMSLGYTEVKQGSKITPNSQVSMLVALMDKLRIRQVDLVANDSGGLIAQMLTASHPERVRTLLLTNCDVDENNPPKKFVPAVEMARKGEFAKKYLLPQLQNKQAARTVKGMIGSAYTQPEKISDETLDIYLQPLVESENRMKQIDEYTVALGENELVALREPLCRWQGNAKLVWALKDEFFPVRSAEWLDKNLQHSTGIRRLEEANLFFPEEFPDTIAQEARVLWGVNKDEVSSFDKSMV